MQTRVISRIFQYTVRIALLIFITYEAFMHQVKGVLEAPNAHVFCPFGGLETLYQLAISGGYIKKIMPATMVLFLASIVLAIVLSRAFCGWICPLGTLQMIFDKIARFFKIKKVQVPAPVEKVLGLVKYVILVVALYFTWKTGELVYAAYDPWAAYAHISAGFEELYSEMLIGSIFLLIALIGSLWLPNNFCRYFCPMGAFLSFFSKFSPSKISRNAQSCINCKKCDRVCPAQITISTEPEVKSAQCLSCGDCIAACPVDNTLDYRIRRQWKLNWFVYGILAVVIFVTPVVIAKQTGLWKVNFENAEEVLVDQSGVLNPYNIKGSMTLESVLTEFDVPREEFLNAFNLPEDTNDAEMLKDIAGAHELETEDFRVFIAEYLQAKNPGLIFDIPLSPERKEVEPASSETEEQSSTNEQPKETEEPTDHASEIQTKDSAELVTVDVRGSTPLKTLLEYGLTKEQFKEVTGVDMPEDTSIILKDFAAQNGLDRETVKDRIIEFFQQ